MATPLQDQVDWMPDQGAHEATYLPLVAHQYRMMTGVVDPFSETNTGEEDEEDCEQVE